MKNTVLTFLFLISFSFFSYTQEVKITLDFEDVKLIKVLNKIESLTDYTFIYNSSDFDIKKKISIKADHEYLSEVLDRLFMQLKNTYALSGKQIIVEPLVKNNKEVAISGSIVDIYGIPIPYISVLLNNGTKGTITNDEGSFTIAAHKGDKISLICLGYKTLDFWVQNQISYNLIMEEDITQLKEVVMMGYGSQAKDMVASSITSIPSKELKKLSLGGVVALDKALGGLVKGLKVTVNTAEPGKPADINIRGYTSPFSIEDTNQPLFVIDGLPMYIPDHVSTVMTDNDVLNLFNIPSQNPLLAININDIERINVLKDAASTAIYGSRGANGVVIITTKKGKKNHKPDVNISSKISFLQPLRPLDVLSGNEFREYYNQLFANTVAAINDGEAIVLPPRAFSVANVDRSTTPWIYNGLNEDFFGSANTSWQDEIFRNAIAKEIHLGVSGGSEKTTYYTSLSHVGQEGIVIKNKLNNYNYKLSVQSNINDYIEMGANANISHSKQVSGGRNPFELSLILRPDVSVYDEEGNFNPLRLPSDPTQPWTFFEANPVARQQNQLSANSFTLIGNSFVKIQPYKRLLFNSTFNFGYYNTRNGEFRREEGIGFGLLNGQVLPFSGPTSVLSSVNNFSWALHLDLKYELAKGNNHDLNITAGYVKEAFISNRRSGVSYEDVKNSDLTFATISGGQGSSFEVKLDTDLYSFFNRINYSYKSKYLATFNIRSDSYINIDSNEGTNLYPSLALGWNIHRENFLLGNGTLNQLKLRISAGRVGSVNAPGFTFVPRTEIDPDFVRNPNPSSFLENNFVDSNSSFEESEEINLGLDFALFNYRFTGSVDLYKRQTKSELISSDKPDLIDFSLYSFNSATLSNEGIEIDLKGDVLRSVNGFNWEIGINAAVNRNVLKDHNMGEFTNNFLFKNELIIGEPIGSSQGFVVEEIFQNQEEIDQLNANAIQQGRQAYFEADGLVLDSRPGDYKYKDIDGNGYIDENDKRIIINPEPDLYGGIWNSFSYKGLSLSANFQYTMGGRIHWGTPNLTNGFILGNFSKNFISANALNEIADNRWSPNNPDARYSRLVYGDPAFNETQQTLPNDRLVFNGSFLRLRNVQLSYSLPKKVAENLRVENITMSLAGSNIWTLTKWPGQDPETVGAGPVFRSVNQPLYPFSKNYTLGLNIQL